MAIESEDRAIESKTMDIERVDLDHKFESNPCFSIEGRIRQEQQNNSHHENESSNDDFRPEELNSSSSYSEPELDPNHLGIRDPLDHTSSENSDNFDPP